MVSSIAQFVDRLNASGVMLPEDSSAEASRFETAGLDREATAFADHLVQQQSLTRYQADAILSGQLDGLVLGEYLVLAELGRGGMGIVYEALHRRMQRHVAIKVLPPKIVHHSKAFKRFEREIQTAARLTHPNIVTCYDAGQKSGSSYLVMELIRGEDLSQVVRRDGPFSVNESIELVAQAAEGLKHAHSHQVVHRDVKPSNLMRCEDGTIKILDFGLASLRNRQESPSDNQRDDDLTDAGLAIGTFNYMSPEQLEDSRFADARSDIYSLGCTLHFLVTGSPPFQAETPVGKLLAHRESPVPELHSLRGPVPRELAELFRSMLAKNPGERPQSAAQVIERLASIRLKIQLARNAKTHDESPDALSIEYQLERDDSKISLGKLDVNRPRSAGSSSIPLVVTQERKNRLAVSPLRKNPLVVGLLASLFLSAVFALPVLLRATRVVDRVPENAGEVAEKNNSTKPSDGPERNVAPVMYKDFSDRYMTKYDGRGLANGVFYIQPKRGGTVWNIASIEDGIVSTSFRLCKGTAGAATVVVFNKHRKDYVAVRFHDDGTMDLKATMLAGVSQQDKASIVPLRIDSLRPIGQFNRIYLVITGRELSVYVNSEFAIGPVLMLDELCPGGLQFGAVKGRGKPTRVEFDDLVVWPTTDLAAIVMPPGVEPVDVPAR